MLKKWPKFLASKMDQIKKMKILYYMKSFKNFRSLFGQWSFKKSCFWDLKFMFSKKATKITKSSLSIWHLLCTKRQIAGEDFVIFCGLLRKHELYWPWKFACVKKVLHNTVFTTTKNAPIIVEKKTIYLAIHDWCRLQCCSRMKMQLFQLRHMPWHS